jgi:hypothetical protein
MLNLYAVTVWHSSAPRHLQMIEVRTYTARRAEHLANESFPGCRAFAEPTFEAIDRMPDLRLRQQTSRTH